MRISNSRAKTFNACRRAYWYKYDRKIRARVSGRPLYYGNWMHQLFEAKFSGRDWRKVHRKLSKEFNSYFDEEKDMLGDLPTECYNKMVSYEFWYRKEDEDLDVLATELELEVPLAHGHTYSLKIDMLTQNEYGLWIWEHKVQDSLPDDLQRYMDMQTARYAYAVAKHTDFGMPVGVVWDYSIRKPATKPQLKLNGELSKRKINTDPHTFISALKEYGLDPQDYRDDIMKLKRHTAFFKRYRVPVTKSVVIQLTKELVYTADEIERGYKPVRSIGKPCRWCDFNKICFAELYGGDTKAILKNNYVKAKGGDDGKEEEVREAA